VFNSLKDKVVLITGASRGIGRACAISFASKGAKVVITARDQHDLQETLNRMKNVSSGNNLLLIAEDLTDRERIKPLIDEVVDRFGVIDILVNNAGQNINGRVEDLDTTKLNYIFQLNFFAPLWLMQEVIPIMKSRHSGQIINISSIAGSRGFPYGGGYCASKFALNGLTESARVELAQYNIDLLLVMPAGTETHFNSSAIKCSKDFGVRSDVSLMKPEYVANKIVKAAERKNRTLVIGFKGKVILSLNWFCGKITDTLLRKLFKL
jgi:dehydrogenase/reductase SDR family member 7B